MNFGIITHAEHKLIGKDIFAYEPYVREMNLWGKHVEEITILAPLSKDQIISKIDSKYKHSSIEFVKIDNFDITSFKNAIRSLFIIPKICFQIYNVMKSVDHIHVRCPGNIGLLGCFIQILFPKKPKTVKYAGNWDPKSKQPLSYRLQKWMLSNTFLTKNCKVLVYGKWEKQTKNIIPFFTASYSKNEIVELPIKDFNHGVNFIFVGTFSKGKQPLLSVKVVEELKIKGYNVTLDMYGDGEEFDNIKNYVIEKNIDALIRLHGNTEKDMIKRAFQKSHFIIFISKSEGWPKVIAEAMFWSCLPISTNVSCVPFMLGKGKRGAIVNDNVNEIAISIESYLKNKQIYTSSVIEAKVWSQEFTLEKFENEIKKILQLKKLSVIQIIDSLNVGGAEMLAVNIANGLSEEEIDSHLCCTRNEGILKGNINSEVGYVFLNRKKTIDFKAILKLHRYIKKYDVKIAHAHSSSSFIAVCVKVINPKIKIIWHDHYGNSEFLDNRNVFYFKVFSYLFSVIISVNNDLKKWSQKNLKTKNVFFIRNFPFFNNQEKITTLNGLDGKRIVHLAGYRKQKDHLNLLKAFLIISKEHKDWTLHLIGKSYNDNYSNKINEFIKSENLLNKVFQYGVCSDIKNVLAQVEIGVLSSKSEGLPISLLEYALSRIPAVTTNVGECNLIIKDKRFIVDPLNSNKLAVALELLIKSRKEREKLAIGINKSVRLKFSKQNTISKLINIYNKNC